MKINSGSMIRDKSSTAPIGSCCSCTLAIVAGGCQEAWLLGLEDIKSRPKESVGPYDAAAPGCQRREPLKTHPVLRPQGNVGFKTTNLQMRMPAQNEAAARRPPCHRLAGPHQAFPLLRRAQKWWEVIHITMPWHLIEAQLKALHEQVPGA